MFIKNITDTIITINDLNITLTPNETKNLSLLLGQYAISASKDLLKYVGNGTIIINDGTNDLDTYNAVKYLILGSKEEPRDRSEKLRVHQTSRIFGHSTFFLGASDDPTNPNDVGGGGSLAFSHKVGDPTTQIYYRDWNIISNRTWLHEAYVQWNNCKLDNVTMDLIPIVTNVVAGVNTNYRIYGPYILPASGTGNWNITSDLTNSHGGLVYMPENDLGVKPKAFWNAEWNSSTGKFENITSAPNGDGRFNLFASEIIFARYCTRFTMMNSNIIKLQTSDSDEIGHGMRTRAICTTVGEDHDWDVSITAVMHRVNTI